MSEGGRRAPRGTQPRSSPPKRTRVARSPTPDAAIKRGHRQLNDQRELFKTKGRSKPLTSDGHRERLRARFMKGGEDALPDYELLELVLFRALQRRDTKALAKQLIARFGSFAEVINAPVHLIKEQPGAGPRVIEELRIVRAAALRLMQGTVIQRPILGSWSQVLDYCHAAMAYEAREVFRILFLDKKNQLIADEVQGRGTVDHAPVYVREVMKRALELSASAIILVHNHPSGDPTPSRADIEMTRLIVEAAKPLGIVIHDHIIIGRKGYASLKAMRLV